MSPKHPLGIGRRLLLGFLTVFIVTAGLAPPANVRAAAEVCGPISNGVAAGFASDGKVLCSGTGIDWYKLPASSCLSVLDSPPGTCGTPISGLGNTLFVQDSVGPSVGDDPTVFSGQSNTNQDLIGVGQNPWHWTAGSTPQKDDLTEAYINVRPASADPNGDTWLVVGAAYRSTSGDKHFDFEFNQKGLTLNANHPLTGNGPDGGRTSGTSGDIVVSIDYQQGGASPCVHVRQWRNVGGTFQFVQVNAQCPPLPGGTRDTAFSAVSAANTATPCLVFANSPGANRTNHYDALQFAEAAVNLSCYLPGFDLGAFCNTVSTVEVKTRSSGSSGFGEAQLKDFLLAPFSLSTPPVANAGNDQSQCAEASGPNTFNLSGSCSSGNCGWNQLSGPTVTFDPTQCATTASVTGPGVAKMVLTCSAEVGCSAADTVSLTVNQNPTVTETHTDVSCNGATDGSIDITVTGGKTPYSFLWSDGPTIEDRTGLGAGTYTVTVTDANGCTGTKTVTINAPTAVTLDLTKQDVSCFGASDGSVTATFGGGTPPYQVQIDAGGFTTESSPKTFTGLAAGSHTVDMKDAHGCAIQKSITVGTPTAVTLDLTKQDVSCFGASDGSVTATFGGGTPPYQVQIDAGGFTTETSPKTFTGLAAGSHTVDMKDAHGCAIQKSIEVGTPTAVTLDLTKQDVSCFGASDGSVTATFGGGTPPYQVQIDAGGFTTETSPKTFTGLAAGSHTVDMKDAHGCAIQKSIDVGTPTAVTLDLTKQDVSCFGASDGSVTATFGGGTPPYQVQIDAGGFTTETSPKTFTGLAAGSHTVDMKDAHGCAIQKSIDVGTPTAVTLDLTKQDVSCFGASDGSVTATFGGGTPPYQVQIDAGGFTTEASPKTFTGLAAGSHTVDMKDAHGCAIQKSIEVGTPTAVTLDLTKQDVSCFGASDGSVTATFGGGTPPYQVQIDAGGFTTETSPKTFTGLAAGSHTVDMKDAHGCAIQKSITV